MPTFQEAVGNALRGGLCAVLGVDESAGKLLSRLTGGAFGTTPLASGLRRQLCSDDPDNDPSYTPPFTGGQCPGTYYFVTMQFYNPNTGAVTGQAQYEGFGPVRVVPSGNQAPGVGGECTVPGQSYQKGKALAFNGVEKVSWGGGCAVRETAEVISVTPRGSEPNNCGDPPPPGVEPGPVAPPPTEITYNIDESTEITVPLTAVYAPIFVDIDGSIKAPVTVNVGGLDFNGSVTISPEFELTIRPTINFGGPGSPDDPDVIGEPGGGPTPIPESEDLESTIIGVLVYSDITSEAGSSGVAFTNGPDLYIPRLASVQFAVKTRDSIGWTSDLDVKNLECYVPCPAPQGAIAVRVSPMPGVQSRFTAVRGTPLTAF